MRLSTATLVNRVASNHSELPKKVTRAIVKDFLTTLCSHLKQQDDIRIDGLGVFKVKERAARMGRNPQTGEVIKIKATKKIAFRPSSALKPKAAAKKSRK